MLRYKRFVVFTTLIPFAFINLISAQQSKNVRRVPMKENFENSLRHTWLNKKVYASRVLHSIEDTSGWSVKGIPLTGFFYTSPHKEAIVNHRHAAFEESPLLALRALCTAFPRHEDWIDWYGAVVADPVAGSGSPATRRPGWR